MTTAEQLFRQAVEVDPQNLMAYQVLGSLYLSQKRLDAARRMFDDMATPTTDSCAATTMIAMILEMQNKTGDAAAQSGHPA